MVRWTAVAVVFLVTCILVIVIHPFVDLPYTTLRSQTVAGLQHFALLLSSIVLVAAVACDLPSLHRRMIAPDRRSALPAEDLVRFTCAYLC